MNFPKTENQHDQNSIVQLIYKYEELLRNFPNQRSMHSCGILISEEPITRYSALEMPPKGFPIVQFDMHTAEDIGLEKFDILSQRGLGTIKDTVNLIEEKEVLPSIFRIPPCQRMKPRATNS